MRQWGGLQSEMVARALLAIAGGYLFASGLAGALGLLLGAVGMSHADAAEAAALVGWLVAFAAGLGVFVADSLSRATIVLIGGGLALLGLAAGLR